MTTAGSTLTPAINTDGDITSINAAQYITVLAANPIIADGTLPFACPGRDNLTDFLYETEAGSIRLTLDPEGAMASLALWEADGQYATETDKATVESGDWTEIDGGDMWEQLRAALHGPNPAQQATIENTARLRGGRQPDAVTRSQIPGKRGRRGQGIITATWAPQEPEHELFEIQVNEAGETLSVDWRPVARAK